MHHLSEDTHGVERVFEVSQARVENSVLPLTISVALSYF